MGPRRATGARFIPKIIDFGQSGKGKSRSERERHLLCVVTTQEPWFLCCYNAQEPWFLYVATTQEPWFLRVATTPEPWFLCRCSAQEMSLSLSLSLSDRDVPFPGCPKSIIWGMNRVPVARLGTILSQDGAMSSKKFCKHLPAPFPPAWGSKTSKNIENRRIGKTI